MRFNRDWRLAILLPLASLIIACGFLPFGRARARATPTLPATVASAPRTATATPAPRTTATRTATSTAQPGSRGNPIVLTSTPTIKAIATSKSGPQLGAIRFAEDVTDEGELVKPGASFPAGTTVVWAYFTSKGVEDGRPWGMVLELDGETLLDDSDMVWDDGDATWVAYPLEADDSEGLATGRYTLTLLIDGKAVQKASFTVAPAAPKQPDAPSFGPVVFATEVTSDGEPVDPAGEFEFGIYEVFATFEHQGMRIGQQWRREWLLGGKVIGSGNYEWGLTRDGWFAAVLTDSAGILSPGEYECRIYVEGELVTSGTFTIVTYASKLPDGPSFGPVFCASEITAEYAPVDPGDEFEYGITELFAAFEHENMRVGQQWRREWLYEGEIVASGNHEWGLTEDGWFASSLADNDEVLPDGEYEFKLYVEGKLVTQGSCTIVR